MAPAAGTLVEERTQPVVDRELLAEELRPAFGVPARSRVLSTHEQGHGEQRADPE